MRRLDHFEPLMVLPERALLNDCTTRALQMSRHRSHATIEASVEQALPAAGCPAAALQAEITESMVMVNAERAMATMHGLNTLGVRLVIDDFGTGYSSLSDLERFPVSRLKIDGSFARDIHSDANDAAIVEAVQGLAKKLGMRTVAEGVETKAQLDFPRALGCDEYAGYLFARPCTSEAFAQLLQDNHGAGPGAGRRGQHATLPGNPSAPGQNAVVNITRNPSKAQLRPTA